MKSLTRIYNLYALAIGMTSYILIDGRFRQTRLTQAYALLLNAFLLTLLPLVYWEMGQIMTMAEWLPPFMWIAPYLLYVLNYAVIAYTLISRCFRDAILLDLQLVVVQVDREMLRTGRRISSKLQRLVLLKTCSLNYLCLSFLLSVVVYQWGNPWVLMLKGLLVSVSFTILVATTYIHFMSFWHIVRGFDYVNQQLEKITSAPRSMSCKRQAEELGNLWALHASLSRVARRLNDYYGPQMLACRFDYFMFTIVNGYFGTIYARYEHKASFDSIFGILIYSIRSVEFFLNDYICDLVSEYQSKAKYTVTEGSRMSHELSSYLIYESSIRLDLRVCGLYPANRRKWLQMMGSILIHCVLLMQFHLVMTRK